MGRHRKPPTHFTQRAAMAAVVATTSGFAVSDSGSFTAVSPADTVQTSPVGFAAAAPAPVQTSPAVGEIPVALPAVVPAPQSVTVAAGDTLDRIARAHGLGWRDLWSRNLSAVPNPNALRVGQVLSLVAPPAPLPPSAVAPAPAHTAPAPALVAAVPAASGLVDLARNFIGTPYRWGGKTASAVDCSGLVYLVLKQAGITNTYRTSGALREWTTPVPRSQARAGDLVFGPGHVGIYAGDGMMVDAPKPGSSVGYRKVYSTMTSYGRIPA